MSELLWCAVTEVRMLPLGASDFLPIGGRDTIAKAAVSWEDQCSSVRTEHQGLLLVTSSQSSAAFVMIYRLYSKIFTAAVICQADDMLLPPGGCNVHDPSYKLNSNITVHPLGGRNMKSNVMLIFPLNCNNNCAKYSEIMTWEWFWKKRY